MHFTVLHPKRWQTLPRRPHLRHILPNENSAPSRAIDGWETMDLAQLMEAADNGDRDAAWKLGDIYREASHGVKYSPKSAFRWYAQSALAGSPTGQNNVGAAFENGFGCQQSYAKAAKWYRLAATQGLNVAMANLAFLYLHGYGTKPDKGEALKWFKKGAAAGCKKSKRMVDAVLGEDQQNQ